MTQGTDINSQPPTVTTALVYTLRNLDREDVESYQFTITARDQTSSPLSSTAQMNVTVGDLNDNAPEFSESSYIISVSEGRQSTLIGIFNVSHKHW